MSPPITYDFPGESDPDIEAAVKMMLERLGEDPDREGLQKTPSRVSKALSFLTSGYRADLEEVLNDAFFEEECNEMVLVRDIELYSLCEHHMLPFVGKAHIAYIPNGRIIGLSKLPRIVDVFARRLQVQERLTQQIAGAVESFLRPRGVAVVLEAAHYCMMMRGVQKQNSWTTTCCMLGEYEQPSRRAEFFDLLKIRQGAL